MDRHLGKRVTAGEVRACSRSLCSSVRSAAAQPPQSLVRLSLALCAPHRPQSRRCAKAEVRACLPRQTRASTEPANRQMIVLGTSLGKLKPRPSAGSCYCRSARAAAAPGLGASLYCSSRFRDLWQVGGPGHMGGYQEHSCTWFGRRSCAWSELCAKGFPCVHFQPKLPPLAQVDLQVVHAGKKSRAGLPGSLNGPHARNRRSTRRAAGGLMVCLFVCLFGCRKYLICVSRDSGGMLAANFALAFVATHASIGEKRGSTIGSRSWMHACRSVSR